MRARVLLRKSCQPLELSCSLGHEIPRRLPLPVGMRNFIKAPIRDPLLISAWGRFKRLWPSMAAWTVLLWATTVVTLLPLSSAVISWRLGRADTLVVGNEDLLSWLISPAGLLTLLVAAGLFSLNWILRFAGVFTLITNDLEGRVPGVANAVWQLARMLPALMRFSIKAVSLFALLLLPLVGGLWAIHLALLGRHDINYFISVQPVEWYLALGAGLAWSAVVLAGAVYFLERVALALPAWLDGHRGFFTALHRSWTLTRGQSGRLVRALAVVAAAWILVRVVVDATMLLLAAVAVGGLAATTDSLGIVAGGVGVFLLSSLMLDLIIDFVGSSLLATVLTTFYLQETRLHQDAPARPALPERTLRWIREGLDHPRGLTLLALMAVVMSIFAGYRLLDRLPPVRPVTVTAHRAGPPPAPENTLAALEAAIASGADFAEIDVQRTRDGVIVVAHDADLMRVAGDPRRISAHDYSSFKSVVQRPDDGSADAERRLATLPDFLLRAKGRIGLNIELKYHGRDPLLVEAVIRDVRAHQMEGAVILMSLNLGAVHQVRALAPDLPVGYVSTVAVGPVLRLPVNLLALPGRRVTPPLLREAARGDVQVHAWTINRAADMADLIEMGVHGLITDDPALAHRVRTELASFTAAERLLLRVRKFLLPKPASVTPPDSNLARD